MKKNIILSVLLCAAGIILCGCENKAPDAADTIPAASITAEEAENIAISDAGINEADITSIKISRDSENGKNIFDVDISDSANEYEYEISAETGEIISKSMDVRNAAAPQISETVSIAEPVISETSPLDTTTVQPAVTESTTTSAPVSVSVNAAVPAAKSITEDEAKSIAFDNAGIKGSDVEYINVKPDRDDGRDVFDVEFYSGGTEYDYEIDAGSGKILSIDKDLENLKIPKNTETRSDGDKITEAKAKEIAFSDAGISEADAKRVKTEFDRDDGREIYEIEFYYNNMEYTYEINAADGAIIDKEIDRD